MQPFFLLAVILILIVVSLAVSWNIVMKSSPKYSVIQGWNKSGFGSRCSLTPSSNLNSPNYFEPQDCDTGLTCTLTGTSPTEGFCLKNIGTVCKTLGECVSGAIICNGVCSTVLQGGLGTTCDSDTDCSGGNICDTSKVNPVCVRPVGSSCSSSSNCFTGSKCSNGVCAPPSSEGSACSSDSGCDDNLYCSSGFCQKTGNTTGAENASCYIWQDPAYPVSPGSTSSLITFGSGTKSVPRCGTGYVCSTSTNFQSNLTYGYCHTSGNWNASCSSNLGCPYPTICGPSGRCVYPERDTSTLITYDPMSCSSDNSTGLCLNNYVCQSGTCQSNINGPAVIFTNCASGKNITNEYYALGLRFDRGDTYPSIASQSWVKLSSALTGSVVNRTVSSLETSSNINILVHYKGDIFHNVYNNSGSTSTSINSALVASGNIYRVGYTLGGNYYCVVNHPTYSAIYVSSYADFNDVQIQTSPYTYNSSSNTIPRYIYWASVDDRVLSGYSTRISFIANTTQASDLRKLYSGAMFVGSLTNITLVDSISDAVWCTNVMSSDMTTTQISATSYLYSRSGSSSVESYSSSTDLGVTAPYQQVINRTILDIAVFTSANVSSSNLPVYTLAKHYQSPQVSDSVVLELTRGYYDFILSANADEGTTTLTTIPSPNLDTSNYSPMFIIITRICT